MTNFFAGLGKRNNENNGQQNSGTNFFAGLNADETPYQRAVRRYNLQNNTAAAEDEPGFFAGLESGFAGVLGGQLHFGEANSPFGGETFGEAANYFDDIVQDNARSKFTNGAELSLDYLTDPQGLRYDMGNTIGSSAALGAETAAAMGLLSQTPVAGAAAAAAKVVPGLGKLWNSGILGKVAVGNVAGSGFEALSEGGNLVPELRAEGYSDEEIQDIVNRAAALNIGGLTLSNLIQSYGASKILGLLGGKTAGNVAKGGMALAGDLARRGTLAAGGGLITNAGEEGMQSAIGNIAKGEPIDWQEVEANAKTGAATGAIMGLGGGVGGGYLQNRALRRAQEQAAAEEENATGFNTIEKMRALEGKIPYEAPDGTNCMRTIGIALEGTPYEGQINVDQAIATARELGQLESPDEYTPQPGDIAVVNGGNHVGMVTENGGIIQNGASHNGVYESEQSAADMFGKVDYYIRTSEYYNGRAGVGRSDLRGEYADETETQTPDVDVPNVRIIPAQGFRTFDTAAAEAADNDANMQQENTYNRQQARSEADDYSSLIDEALDASEAAWENRAAAAGYQQPRRATRRAGGASYNPAVAAETPFLNRVQRQELNRRIDELELENAQAARETAGQRPRFMGQGTPEFRNLLQRTRAEYGQNGANNLRRNAQISALTERAANGDRVAAQILSNALGRQSVRLEAQNNAVEDSEIYKGRVIAEREQRVRDAAQREANRRDMLQSAEEYFRSDAFDSPLEGVRSEIKGTQDGIKNLLRPIVDTILTGGGDRARLLLTEDDYRRIRASQNMPYYSEIYKKYGRKPTMRQLYDVARDVYTGRNSYGIPGWERTVENEADFAHNEAVLKELDENLEMYEELEKKFAAEPNGGRRNGENTKRSENNDKNAEPEQSKADESETREKGEADEAKKQVNKKAAADELADGYKTTSGRPLNEADADEFIVKPDGSIDFGEITQEIANATNGELEAAPIRLKVGNEREGLIHAKKHEKQVREIGYKSIEEFITDVAENFDRIYKRDNGNANPTYILIKTGNKSENILNAVAPVYFEISQNNDGNYYVVISAMPKGDRSLVREIKKELPVYSRPGLDSAAISNDGAVSVQGNSDVGVTQERIPTSDNTGNSVTSTVPQKAENVKVKPSQRARDRVGESFEVFTTDSEDYAGSVKINKIREHNGNYYYGDSRNATLYKIDDLETGYSAELENEIRRERERIEDARREKREREEAEAAKRESERFDGYTDNMSPMQRSKVAQTLNMKFTYTDNNGKRKVMTRAEHMRDVADRDEQLVTVENWNGKRDYRVYDNKEGTGPFETITKTEYDYYNWYYRNRANAADNAPQGAEQAETAGDRQTPAQENKTAVSESNAPAATQNEKQQTDKESKPKKNSITEKKAKIEDFGEKIGGARKDVYAMYKDVMNEAEKLEINAVPFSKSWPEPDYEKLLESGTDKNKVAFMRALRDAIPAKPKRAYALKQWEQLVRTFRSFAGRMLDDDSKFDYKEFIDKYGIKGLDYTLKKIVGRAKLYEAVGHKYSLKDLTLDAHTYSVFNGQRYDKPKTFWVVEQRAKTTMFSNMPKQIAYAETEAEAIKNFAEKYNEFIANKTSGKPQVSFELYIDRSTKEIFIGKKLGRTIIRLKEGFKTAKEAREYENSHFDELVDSFEKAKEVPRERGDINRPRVGADMRGGLDVSPELFTEAFGFRGVEFGNWVENNRRQQDLNNAYDALMDMAAILNINPKAISLNGTLGLAFGARGRGGTNAASAHYEPTHMAINLTKMNGAGSLGHEWFHALDNMFGKKSQSEFASTSGNAVIRQHNGKMEMRGDIRLAVVDAFAGIRRAILSSGMYERSKKLDNMRAKDYWTNMEEMQARAFEKYLIEKLHDQGASNDYLANVVPENVWGAVMSDSKSGTYPYPLQSEMLAIREAFDNLFNVIEQVETDKGIMLNEDMQSYTADDIINISEEYYQQALFDYPELADESEGVKNGVQKGIQATYEFGALQGDIVETAGDTAGSSVEGLSEQRRRNNEDITENAPSRKPGNIPRISKTLGTGITKELVNDGAVSLVGKKVRSIRQLAEYSQVLRHPGYEKFHRVYVNKNGVIIGHETISTMLPAETAIFEGASISEQQDSAYKNFVQAQPNDDVAKVYYIHNHPSGNPTPSQLDIDITRKDLLKEAGIKFGGHIILDTTKFSVIDAKGKVSERNIPEKKQIKYDVAGLPHKAIGETALKSEDVVAKLIKTLDDESATTAFFVTAKMETRAVVQLPKEVNTLSAAGLNRYLRMLARRHYSANCILSTADRKVYSNAKKLVKKGYMVDAVLTKPRSYKSAFDTAGRKDEITFFGKRAAETGGKRVLEQPAEYMPTDSPEFKKWFNGSKVVDKNGGPLVVYHGTANDFYTFDMSRSGENYADGEGGFFFTDNKSTAERYAALATGQADNKGRVIDAYLSIKNPLTAKAPSAVDAIDYYDMHSGALLGEARAQDNDGIIIEGSKRNVYVAFKPEQIKSASENTGSFDANNPDIRYSATDAETQRRSAEAVANELADALPTAKFSVNDSGDVVAEMPNGVRFKVNVAERLIVNDAEAARARGEHGLRGNGELNIEGAWQNVSESDVDGILSLSQTGRAGTAYHEVMHAALDLALNDKERSALVKAFNKKAQESGKAPIEEVCDGYVEWKRARARRSGTAFGKLFNKMQDLFYQLKELFTGMENAHNVMRRVASGEAWENSRTQRGNGGNSYKVTNAKITGKTEVPVVDVTGLPKINANSNAIKREIAKGLIGKTFRIIGSDGIGRVASISDGKHLVGSSQTNQRYIPERQQALSAIDDILNSAVYVEKHPDARRGADTRYIELYAAVKNGNNLTRFRIVVKEGDKTAGEFEVKDAKFYDIIKDGNISASMFKNILPAHTPQMGAQVRDAQNVPSTLSVAQLLEGVKDRDGNLYVINGELNYDENVHYSATETATPEAKAAQAFTNTERKTTWQSVKEWVKKQRTEFYRDWIDKNDSLHGLDEAIEMTTGIKTDGDQSVYNRVQTLPATAAGMANALIEGDSNSLKALNERLKNKKLPHNVTMQMVLENINREKMDKAHPDYLKKGGFKTWIDAFGAFLGCVRLNEMLLLHDEAYQQSVKEWEANGKKGRKPQYKPYKMPNGLTQSDLESVIKNAPPEFRKAAQMYYQFNNNVLTVMEDAGLISAETHKLLNTKYKYYCPLMRDFSDTAAADNFINGLSNGGRGIGNVSSMLRRISIEGSERNVINPLESTIKAVAVMCNRAERNKVGQMAVELAQKGGLDAVIQEAEGTVADPKNCIFTVMFDGEKKAYKTTQELYGPIVGYNLPAAGFVLGVARNAARLLRAGATTSPSFIIRNLIRDTVFAGVSSKNGFTPIVDTIRGAYALARDPRLRAEFKVAGVTQFNLYSSSEQIVKSLDEMAGGKAWKDYGAADIWRALMKYPALASEFVESSTRMGEFMKARKKGASLEEAAQAARELTLDFSRSGVQGEKVNQIVPFFNAVLQGSDKMVRLIKQDPVGTGTKLAMYIVLPSLALWALNHDEDWYKEIDPEVKATCWLLPGGLRIPKPQEAGILFGSGIEAVLDQAFDKDPEAISNWAKVFGGNIAPSIMPTIFLPLLEWQANYSFFRGQSITPQRLQNLPDELQYTPNTSAAARTLGSVLKLSPVKIDNTIRGYTGTMGMTLVQQLDWFADEKQNMPYKKVSEWPFLRDFTVNQNIQNRSVDDFYKMLNKANEQHAGYGVKGKPSPAVKGVRAAGKLISEAQKDIRELTVNPRLSPEVKRQRIDQKKTYIKNIAKKANARFGRFFED